MRGLLHVPIRGLAARFRNASSCLFTGKPPLGAGPIRYQASVIPGTQRLGVRGRTVP